MTASEVSQPTVYRDRGIIVARWVVVAIAGPVAVAVRQDLPVVAWILGAATLYAVAMIVTDRPRVELHTEHLAIVRWLTDHVGYDEIKGMSTGSRTWFGRSGLVIDRGYGLETRVPPGLGLGPPEWHLELRDDISGRLPSPLV